MEVNPGIQPLAIGEEVVGGTIGSVLFIDGSGDLGEDNLNFFWDDTNNILKIGTTVFQGGKTFSTSTNTAALGVVSTYMCNDTTAIRTLTISSADIALASATNPWTFEVVDISGGAGTNSITIDTEGAETINGVASIDIAVDYGSVVLTCNGSNLFVKSSS